MQRYLAYVAFIFVLAPIEATLPRLPGLHDVRALLLVPLVLFFSLRLNTIEGVLLTALAGVVEEATIGYPPGLATFTLVALFVGGRLALATIRADGPIFEAFFAFILAGFHHAIIFGLRRAFEAPHALGRDAMRLHLWSCVATAIATPFITRVARRIEKLEAKSSGLL
jgi:cell shape-determining protein MreD